MRRLVITAVAMLAAGCAYTVQGAPVREGDVLDVDPPFSTERSAPPTTSESNAPVDGEIGAVCALLKWNDLPYQGTKADAPPTQINYDATFDQSCKWQTKAGTKEVGASLRFREGKSIKLDKSTGTYDVGGRTVTYYDRTEDPEVEPSCVLVMDYAGGGLGIIVIDGSQQFGSICEQGKHIAEVLVSREPV